MLPQLLISVRDYLRTNIPLVPHECQIEPDERPDPASGQIFYSVYGNNWSNEVEEYLKESFGIGITITMRAPISAYDKWGEDLYVEYLTGICDRLNAVIPLIHRNYVIMNNANTLLTTSTEKLITPLYFLNADAQPRIVGPEWFLSKPDYETTPQAGMYMTAKFGKCLRARTIPGNKM